MRVAHRARGGSSPQPGKALVADLDLLTARYRQPRSAYLPFLEAGHILENLALSRLGDHEQGTTRYTVAPALLGADRLRLVCFEDGAEEDGVAEPDTRAASESRALNPTLMLRGEEAGLQVVSNLTLPRTHALGLDGYERLTRFLRHGPEGLTALDLGLLQSSDAVVAPEPAFAPKLASVGWHGAVIGWLGAPRISRGPQRTLSTVPLLEDRRLAASYAARRTTHHFAREEIPVRALEAVLRPVRPDLGDVDMHLVMTHTGRMWRWDGDGMVPSGVSAGSVPDAVTARPRLTSPAGYLVLTPYDVVHGLGDALVRLGRSAQRAVLALTAHGIASCVLSVDDDAPVRALIGVDRPFEPTYCIAFGCPA